MDFGQLMIYEGDLNKRSPPLIIPNMKDLWWCHSQLIVISCYVTSATISWRPLFRYTVSAHTTQNRLIGAHLYSRRPYIGPIFTRLHRRYTINCWHLQRHSRGTGIESCLAMHPYSHGDISMVSRRFGIDVVKVTIYVLSFRGRRFGSERDYCPPR